MMSVIVVIVFMLQVYIHRLSEGEVTISNINQDRNPSLFVKMVDNHRQIRYWQLA